MKVVNMNKFANIFPMRIICKRIVDEYGYAYGQTKDFCGSELEIEAEDVKKHKWFKYPNYEGVDYGVVCPVCKNFIAMDKTKIPSIILNNAEEIYLNR